MEYNTTLPPIVMREYGRNIQRFIDAACAEPNRERRMQMAQDIASTMIRLSSEKGNSQEKQNKIWNHIAQISGYQLDIDYPCEIIHSQK